VADDIVIVDTGSTDQTLAIAHQFGARTRQIEWPNDFAQARNVALEMVQTPWVLVMDADEVLVREDIPLLEAAIKEPFADAYNIRIVSLANKAENISESYVLRLFRALPNVRFEGRVHEQVFPSLIRLGLTVQALNIRLLHYGYMDGVSTERHKAQRNLELLIDALRDNPDEHYLLWQLAHTYLGMGEGPRAIDAATKSLKAMTYESPIRPLAYLTLAKAYYIERRFRKSLSTLEIAGNEFPHYTDIYYWKGIARMGLGEWDQAIKEFSRCINLGEPKGFLYTETGVGTFKSLYRLAQCYGLSGKPKEALAHLLVALQKQPSFREGWQYLFNFLQGQPIEQVYQYASKVLEESQIIPVFESWNDRNPNEEAFLSYLKQLSIPKS